MLAGKYKGFFAWGQNPACSGSNAGKVRKALAKLEWMVNVNLFDNETASFWRGPGVNPADVKTEVFMLPCAASIEKEGSITNSGRWAQWRYKAVEPPGEAQPDAEIMNELALKVRELYAKEGGAFPDPVLKTAWDYGEKVNTHDVAREINGYWTEDKELTDAKTGKVTGTFKKGQLVGSFALLQADGSTSSGNWLYCNSYTDADPAKGNKMARRGTEDPSGIGLYLNWSWCWPVNRRIIYNRASVDEYGRPWDEKRAVIKWVESKDPATGLVMKSPEGKTLFKWSGDVPDGGWPPLLNADGTSNPAAMKAFIMKPAGVAHIFATGLNDGPFPEHYEPLECPIQENPLSKAHRINPTSKLFSSEPGTGNAEDVFESCSVRYPVRRDDLPRDRTLADRRHDPSHPVAARGGAAELPRTQSRARGGEGDRQRRHPQGLLRARRDQVQGRRDRPLQAVQGHGLDRAPGRHALVLRLAVPGGRQRRRQREPADADHRRRQHHDSRDEGLHGQRRESVGGLTTCQRAYWSI